VCRCSARSCGPGGNPSPTRPPAAKLRPSRVCLPGRRGYIIARRAAGPPLIPPAFPTGSPLRSPVVPSPPRAGPTMPHPSKRPQPPSDETFPPGSVLAFLADRNQVDFELEFYGKVLTAAPEFHEVLRAQASNMTVKGRLQDGLAVDKKLVALRPSDPT